MIVPATSFDVEIMARTLFGEARGEPDQGKIAVAWVILNRCLDDRWPATLAAVCLQPFQFSTWNARDPNLMKIASVTTDDEDFAVCMALAWGVAAGLHIDQMKCNHYLSEDIADTLPPPWFDRQYVVGRIGSHLFLRL